MENAGFIFVMVIGIAAWGGCTVWNNHQQHQAEHKRLEAVKAVAREETERLRIFAEVLTRRPVQPGNNGAGKEGLWN
ncbi:MAG: hypothetical protein CVU66_00650 [Deltaproteobacteria bacterium HGW-Deltaproteobacteria-23]|nr:MAG: hypothetical protein CVU66_00650 [Deltaproteobacteria bacterium HGW-Deltaproteobacteria-23]